MQLVNSVAPFLLNSRLKAAADALAVRAPFHRERLGDGGPVLAPQDDLPSAHEHGESGAQHDDAHFRRRLRPRRHLHEQRRYRLGHGRKPHAQAIERSRKTAASFAPLDIIDGMARIYHPIAQGIESPEEPLFGLFLKDYAPCPW